MRTNFSLLSVGFLVFEIKILKALSNLSDTHLQVPSHIFSGEIREFWGAKPVLSTCPLHTISGCGKERRILIGPW